jgi:type VI protein secretion system component VasF
MKKVAQQVVEAPKLTSQRDADLVSCLTLICQGDYTVLPQGNDELSEAVRKIAVKFSSNAQEEMSRVVNLSIQANETAIFSAQMLSNLKK